jgi:predicted transcriptional regulator
MALPRLSNLEMQIMEMLWTHGSDQPPLSGPDAMLV